MVQRIILGAVLLLVGTAGSAGARSLEVETFDATIEVRADGVVAVEERLAVRFHGSFNGIFRNIPYGYTYAGGMRGMIQLDLEAVEDGEGRPLEHWTKRRRGYLRVKIRVPGASDALRTVVLKYRGQNVIRPQEGAAEGFGVQDELYWNVTGDEWEMPILKAVATIKLPDAIAPSDVRAKAYTGFRGQRGTAAEVETLEDGRLRIATTRVLHPMEGMTIAVLFPPGHVAYPTTWQKIQWWFEANWYVLIPFALLAFWLFAWWRWGRDPMSHRTIIPDWKAPEGLRPSEVGVLVDDKLDQRDLTAAIVDLAVRGVLTIHEEDDESFRLVLDPKARKKADLAPYEDQLLDELFTGGETETTLGDHKHGFVKGLKRIRDSVLDDLVTGGFFPHRPDRQMERWSGWTFLALIGFVVLGFWQQLPWPYWVVSALCIIPMFVLARYMPRRTKRGLDALARVMGMEEYLVTAERTRMKEMPMDHFEALLPYAIALGVHERWSMAFEGVFTESPTWYRSQRSGFDTLWFYYVMTSMNRSVGSNLMSGPRAQSSSGWGGGYSGGGGFSGGFSGGGFGGGGGGGW